MTNDLAALRRQVQELARAQARTARQVQTLAIAPRAGYTSIDAGALTVNDDTGTPRVVLGAQADGSYTVTAVGATPPVAPSAPVLEAQPGAVSITWDGATSDESAWLADWSHVEAHVGGAAGFEATAENQVGTFTSRSGGTFMVGRPAGPVWVKLTAVNSSGAISSASAEATIVVPDVPEPSGSDGEVPPPATDLSVRGGIGSLYYRWSPVTNADIVTYELYVRAGSAPELTDAYRVADTYGTSQPIRQARRVNPATSVEEMMDIIPGVDYHAVLVASDADGPAPATAVVVGQAAQVNSEDLALNALTTDHLTANEVIFIALQGETIIGVTIEGATVEGGVFRTSLDDRRIELGPGDAQLGMGQIRFYAPGFTTTASINSGNDGGVSLTSGAHPDTPTEPGGSVRTSGLHLSGIDPTIPGDVTGAVTEAQFVRLAAMVDGVSYSPELGVAQIEASTRVDVEAPNIALTGNVQVAGGKLTIDGNDVNSPPFGYLDFAANNYVGTQWRYPTGAANSGSFLRGGVTIRGGGVVHSTDGLNMVDTSYGIVAPRRGIYNVFGHVAFKIGTVAATTMARRGIQFLRNGATAVLAEDVASWHNAPGRTNLDGWVLLEAGDVVQMRYFIDVANHVGGIDYARVGIKFSQA